MLHRARSAALLLPVIVLLSASPASGQDKVQLARKAKVGDVTRMANEMALAVNAGGRQALFSIKGTEKNTVTEVGSDGRLTVRQEAEGMVMSVDGTPQPPQPAPPPSVSVIGRDRLLMSYTDSSPTPNPSPVTYRMWNATTIFFSDKAVGVGEAWTRDVQADAARNVFAAKAEYKMLALEKLGAVDTAKISMAFQEAAPDGIKVAGTCWVDVATGEDVKCEFEFQNLPLIPGAGPVNGSLRQSRVAGGAVPEALAAGVNR